MPCKRQLSVLVIILTALVAQSCVLVPRPPDPQPQELAIKRWNGCLVRSGVRADRLCEGYRRDVLVTYPAHLERQINAKLTRHARIVTASTARQTRFGVTVRSRNIPLSQESLSYEKEVKASNL